MLLKRAREEDDDDESRKNSVSRTSSSSSSAYPSEATPLQRRDSKRAKREPSAEEEDIGFFARGTSPEIPLPDDDHANSERWAASPEVPLPHELPRDEGMESDDEYASWEKPVSTPEMQRARKELAMRRSDDSLSEDGMPGSSDMLKRTSSYLVVPR